MGLTVCATASKKHHGFLKGLGAHQVFDYKEKDVVASIVKAATDDGVAVEMAYLALSQLMPCVNTLKELKGAGTARVAVAPFQLGMLWWKTLGKYGGEICGAARR